MIDMIIQSTLELLSLIIAIHSFSDPFVDRFYPYEVDPKRPKTRLSSIEIAYSYKCLMFRVNIFSLCP